MATLTGGSSCRVAAELDARDRSTAGDEGPHRQLMDHVRQALSDHAGRRPVGDAAVPDSLRLLPATTGRPGFGFTGDPFALSSIDSRANGLEPKVVFDARSIEQALGRGSENGSGAGAGLLQPEDRAEVAAALAELARSGHPLGPVDLRVRRADGTWAELEWHGVDLRDRPGVAAIVVTARDASARNDARRELERQVDGLLSLQRVDLPSASRAGIDETLRVLLVELSAHLQAAGATILVARDGPERLEVHTTIGREVVRGSRLRGDPAFDVYLRRRPATRQLTAGSGPASVADMPLLARGTALGVLEVAWRQPHRLEAADVVLLEAFASRAAIALDDHRLWTALRRSRHRLEVAYDRTLEGWVRALDLRDHETEGHTQRVTGMTLRLAHRFGISGEDLLHLRRGAMLHDIGKLAIPDQILLKPGPLTPGERTVIEQHPVFARRFLEGIDALQPAMDIPFAHHERWDGGGYPQGLAGEAIPFAARLFAIVDVWDALRSDRPYRAAWSDEKVHRYLREESGRHFDPRVVAAFLSLLEGGGTREARPTVADADLEGSAGDLGGGVGSPL